MKSLSARIPAVFFAIVLCALALCLLPSAAFAAGLNVNQHSKQEIINQLKASGVSKADSVEFAVEPVKYGTVGDMTPATKTSALKMLNNIRYVAGLDSVALDTTQGENAQAAAFVDWCIGQLTHYPQNDATKPDTMPDDLWNKGALGAGNSNIAYGRDTLNDTILFGWMADASSSSNVKGVGHRRWCLNPRMATTGFGATTGETYRDKYYAMWSGSQTAGGTQTNVAWPARYMPVEYFASNIPWHLSTGNTSITDLSNVNVTLERRSSSPSGYGRWTFSSTQSYTAQPGTSEFFGVAENYRQGYSGQPGPYVVFRPADTTYKPGDVFDVSITGLGSENINYTVEFFSGYPVESLSLGEGVHYVTPYEWQNTLSKTVAPADASGYEVQWASSDESVCTVNQGGKVTGIKPGTVTVTATIPGAYTATGQPVTATKTVVVPKSISDCTIQVANPEYTGEVVRPTVTITDPVTGYTLQEGVDFTLSFPQDVAFPTDGSAIVWIYG